MALDDCYECGAQVSTNALRCPHCGFEFMDEGYRYPIGRYFIEGLIAERRVERRRKEAEAKKAEAEAKKLAAEKAEKAEKARKFRKNLIGYLVYLLIFGGIGFLIYVLSR